MKGKTAFLFPGQGSIEESDTRFAQPAIFSASIEAFKQAFKQREQLGTAPDAAAGHSLGEYAAMAAAGIISEEDGLKAVTVRGEIMARAAEKGGGGMAAAVGLPPETVEAVLAEIADVWPVNYNSPLQTVIAGSLDALAKAEAALSAKGAKRVIRLNVSGAFHTEFMKDAAEEFREFAKTLTFSPPKIAFYSNLTGGLMTDFSDMPGYLAKHMCSPVRFTDELRNMKKDGIENFVEIGPGKILTGLVKKTIGAAEI